MARMATAAPARKLVAGSLGSALTTVILYAVTAMGGPDLPTPIQGAIIVIVTFVVGYYVPPAARDQVVSAQVAP